MAEKSLGKNIGCLKGLGLFLGGLVLVVIIIAIIDPAQDKDGAKPDTIAAIDKDISSVSRDNDYLNINVAMRSTWDGESAISKSAMIALDVIKKVQMGASDAGGPGLKAVQLTYSVPTRTALGEEGRADLINIQISDEILKAAKPEKMTYFDVLEVATIEIPSRIGKEAATEYCAENIKFNDRFCARLAFGML